MSREQITPLEGLPALSLDALTSVAYGPEAIIAALAVAGTGALHLILPITIAIVVLLAIIVVGLIHPLALHATQPGRSLLPAHGVEAVSVLLVLKAFSAGCSALTGVEAVANGVPLFKRPRQVRAKRTELLLGVILSAMLVGLAVLADRWPGTTSCRTYSRCAMTGRCSLPAS